MAKDEHGNVAKNREWPEEAQRVLRAYTTPRCLELNSDLEDSAYGFGEMLADDRGAGFSFHFLLVSQELQWPLLETSFCTNYFI